MPMLQELHRDENLKRAWRWLRSNPDAGYKEYFRDLYGIYEIADDRLLANLKSRLRRGIYEPNPACKLFLPKPSGILRPFSLLTLEDQIVYQAAVNLVAERLFPRVKHRYNSQVFGHLYAGKSSVWFYRSWKEGYKAFNDAARAAYEAGFRVTASFDLTACYDSLDHAVLRHMLKQLGCDQDFCAQLTDWLTVWTATDRQIYHNHGIPQGPLSSGLLSEVVLRHFDDTGWQKERVHYFRYVDDIRLFAKTESHLRKALVKLDLLSKDIGLFPQASKIGIHVVKDIDDELKSVSHPLEAAIRRPMVDQERLRKRLVELSPHFRVSNPTRFKYLLAHALPNAGLTARLWRIFENQPDYYVQLGSYLSRYRKLPEKSADRLIKEIESQSLYPAVRSALLRAAHGRMRDTQERRLARLVKQKIWIPKTLAANLYASAGKILLNNGQFTVPQLNYALRAGRPWWGRSQILLEMSPDNTAMNTLTASLNIALRDTSAEVAMAAALSTALHSVPISQPQKNIHHAAADILKSIGILSRSSSRQCGVDESLRRMLGAIPKINWKNVFSGDYRTVEKHIVYARALANTNVTAWVNAMDVFNDWLLAALYRHDPSIGKYQLGHIGSVLSGGRLKKKYPDIFALVDEIHARRLESALSHPTTKQTGKPTKPIKWSYFRTGKKLLRSAIRELAAKW